MKMFLKDDFLTQEERESVIDYWIEYRKSKFYKWVDSADFISQSFPLDKIINFVSQHFDLISMVGAECWAHIGTRPPGIHVDRDERYFSNTGVLVTPLCSIVYYADIQNLDGGRLSVGGNDIDPITNRLIMFSSGAPHSVETYTGTRMALLINPWHYKIQLVD